MSNIPDTEQYFLRSEVLARLKVAVLAEMKELELANKERPLSAVAWIARNILELLIWVDFCSRSEENARTSRNDSARDAVDAIDIPKEFSRDGTFDFRGARAEVIEEAKELGFDSVDDSYTRVPNAAKAIGQTELFRHSNKLYSKFAHPTALVVMTDMSLVDEGLRKSFLEGGKTCGKHALRIIEKAEAATVSTP